MKPSLEILIYVMRVCIATKSKYRTVTPTTAYKGHYKNKDNMVNWIYE